MTSDDPNPLGNRAGLMLAEDAPAARVGTVVGRWKLIVHLGRAGRSDHYRVEPVMGGAPADLYVVTLDPDALAHFDVATSRSRRIGHPLLATPTDAGMTDVPDERFVVLPIKPGRPLVRAVPPSGMAPRDAARAGLEALDALEVLHREGVFLGGLPLAAVVSSESSLGDLRFPGAPWLVDGTVGEGTDALAPEGPTSPSADQYALGMFLRALLAGTARAAPTGTPDAMLDLVARLTRDAPTERFADFGPVRERLEAILGVAPEAAPPPRRAVWPWVVAALALLLVGGSVAAVGLYALSGGGPTDSAPVRSVSGLVAEPGREPTAPDPAASAEPVAPVADPAPAPRTRPAARVPAPDLVQPSEPSPETPEPSTDSELSEPPGPATPGSEPPDTVPSEPSTSSEPDAVADAVTPAVTPAAPEPAAEPLPAPSPRFDPAPFAGRWTGERAGRPLVLTLRLAANGTLSGTAAVRVGSREASLPIAGRWTEGEGGVQVDFSEQGPRPSRYTGTIRGSSGSGPVFSGGKERGRWSVGR